MKCHYEVLEVERDANSDDIKKAHRRLAMKWHPDKNLDNTEVATEEFKLIQQAFEVLSDPHERAWYDDHREAILKGKVGAACDDDSLDVYQYFTASCYQGFDDDEKGFYSVYREVFNKITAEDSEYQGPEDSDFEVPSFGSKNSSHEEVNSFYNYWQSYCTKKSYSWMDTYDTREAPNRRISRAMEKENKKIRDKARKARNEEVRELVKFVRKRDKRVQAYVQYLQELSVEKAKKSEQIRVEKLKERKLQLASHKESEWAKFSNVEKELKDIEANLASEFGDSISSENSDYEEEFDDNNLYCVACNKLFKTSKAFENHEISKKHKENIQILKVKMQDSDDGFDLDSDDPGEEETSASDENGSVCDDNSSEYIEEDNVHDSNEVVKNEDTNCNRDFLLDETGAFTNDEPLFCKACGRWFKTIKAVSDHKSSENHKKNVILYQEILKNLGSETEDDDDGIEDFENNLSLSSPSEQEFLEDFVNGDKSIKEDLERVMSKFDALEETEQSSLHDDVEKLCFEIDDIIKKNAEEEEIYKSNKKDRKKNCSKELEDSSDDSDFSLGTSKKKKRKQKNKRQIPPKNEENTNKFPTKSSLNVSAVDLNNDDNTYEISSNSQDSITLNCDDSTNKSASDTDNQDRKSKQSTVSNKKKQGKISTQNLGDTNTSCAVCKSSFPSKNKLFQHLKKTGHSVFIPEKSSKSEVVDKDCSKKGKNKKNKK